MKIEPIRKGGSLPYAFDRDGQPIEGWECVAVVRQYPTSPILITEPVAVKDGRWQGLLTSPQTDTLPEGITYRLFGILTNPTTLEKEQVETRFSVTTSWAA